MQTPYSNHILTSNKKNHFSKEKIQIKIESCGTDIKTLNPLAKKAYTLIP